MNQTTVTPEHVVINVCQPNGGFRMLPHATLNAPVHTIVCTGAFYINSATRMNRATPDRVAEIAAVT